MTPRMTAEGVTSQQGGVGQHHQRTDTDAEAPFTEECPEALPPEEYEQDERAVQGVTMEVLKHEQRPFPAVRPTRTANTTGGRPQGEGFVVRPAIVVTRESKCDGQPGQKEG